MDPTTPETRGDGTAPPSRSTSFTGHLIAALALVISIFAFNRDTAIHSEVAGKEKGALAERIQAIEAQIGVNASLPKSGIHLTLDNLEGRLESIEEHVSSSSGDEARIAALETSLTTAEQRLAKAMDANEELSVTLTKLDEAVRTLYHTLANTTDYKSASGSVDVHIEKFSVPLGWPPRRK